MNGNKKINGMQKKLLKRFANQNLCHIIMYIASAICQRLPFGRKLGFLLRLSCYYLPSVETGVSIRRKDEILCKKI